MVGISPLDKTAAGQTNQQTMFAGETCEQTNQSYKVSWISLSFIFSKKNPRPLAGAYNVSLKLDIDNDIPIGPTGKYTKTNTKYTYTQIQQCQ